MDNNLAKPIRFKIVQAMLKKWWPDREKSPHPTRTIHPLEERPVSSPTNPLPFDPEMVAQWQPLGGPPLFSSMVHKIVPYALTCVDALESAMASHDAKALAEGAQGLKGICRNMDASNLADFAQTMKKECQHQIPPHVPRQVVAFRTAIDHISPPRSGEGKP